MPHTASSEMGSPCYQFFQVLPTVLSLGATISWIFFVVPPTDSVPALLFYTVGNAMIAFMCATLLCYQTYQERTNDEYTQRIREACSISETWLVLYRSTLSSISFALVITWLYIQAMVPLYNDLKPYGDKDWDLDTWFFFAFVGIVLGSFWVVGFWFAWMATISTAMRLVEKIKESRKVSVQELQNIRLESGVRVSLCKLQAEGEDDETRGRTSGDSAAWKREY